MVFQLHSTPSAAIVYAENDGQPMSDNTKQFRWIVVIKENLERLFADRPDIFVAGDLLWYPIEDDNVTRQAPDAMVVFGRPKGDRGSYQQWLEGNIPPQVVFEILSPGNRLKPLVQKFKFYERYGVQEYYVYDPDSVELIGWLRQGDELEAIEMIENWVSPQLGVRFDLSGSELQIFRPDGQPFLTFVELAQQLERSQSTLNQTQQELNQVQQALDAERTRSQALEARLRQLGIEPE
jgi:Uma2 family endonuclease